MWLLALVTKWNLKPMIGESYRAFEPACYIGCGRPVNPLLLQECSAISLVCWLCLAQYSDFTAAIYIPTGWPCVVFLTNTDGVHRNILASSDYFTPLYMWLLQSIPVYIKQISIVKIYRTPQWDLVQADGDTTSTHPSSSLRGALPQLKVDHTLKNTVSRDLWQ